MAHLIRKFANYDNDFASGARMRRELIAIDVLINHSAQNDSRTHAGSRDRPGVRATSISHLQRINVTPYAAISLGGSILQVTNAPRYIVTNARLARERNFPYYYARPVINEWFNADLPCAINHVIYRETIRHRRDF